MHPASPTLSSARILPFPDMRVIDASTAGTVSLETKRWVALAVGSMVIAGLLSLAVVLGRLPVLSGLIGDPLFFKRCLVVHVNLALVVWFYAFIAGLNGLRLARGTGRIGRAAFGITVLGVGLMLAGALARGAQPVLSNYIPMIDHPVFLAGIATVFIGIVTTFAQTLAAPAVPGGAAGRAGGLPDDAATGLQTAALAVVLAAATFVSALSGLPGGLDPWTRYEFLAWGPGHVLQVANVAAMLAVWLWLLARATGRPVLSSGAARGLFALLLAPHFAMPLLTMRGTLNNLYHDGATQLMRWGIFPVVIVVLVLGVRHWWRERVNTGSTVGPDLASAPSRYVAAARTQGPDLHVRSVALAGFAASAGLTVFGFILGACIRSSTTLVPAHYHASLGGITVAFMAAAYLVGDAAVRDGLPARVWRSARRQLAWFGVGQAVFVIGFAVGGLYGLGRKAYASEQHVRSAGELTGLGVMGLGGLMAAVAGIWFMILVLRAMRGWSFAALAQHASPAVSGRGETAGDEAAGLSGCATTVGGPPPPPRRSPRLLSATRRPHE